MTEDYKEKLLKYITNNFEVEDPNENVPSFDEHIYMMGGKEIYEALKGEDSQFTYGTRINGTLQCKDALGNDNGFMIIYGYYFGDSEHTLNARKGFLCLINNKFELVKLITEYSSGTDCGIFMKLNVAEDGTLYGLDYSSEHQRFIQLNNPSFKNLAIDDYELVLRKSYYLQGAVANIAPNYTSKYYVLEKDPNSANYLIGVVGLAQCIDALTQFKINVGSANEWTDYTSVEPDVSDTQVDYFLYFYVNWVEEQPDIHAYFTIKDGDGGGEYSWNYYLYVGTNDDTEITFSEVFSGEGYSTLHNYGGTALGFVGTDNFYFSSGIGYEVWNNEDQYEYTLGTFTIYHYRNGTLDPIYQLEEELTTVSQQYILYPRYNMTFTNIDGTMCGDLAYRHDAVDSAENEMFNLYNFLITNEDKVVAQYVGHEYNSSYNSLYISLKVRQYDLYNFYTLYDLDDSVYMEKDYITDIYSIIYNKNRYNGQPYQALNSLSPEYAVLKCKIDAIYSQYDYAYPKIFARELYNKVVSDYITEATIEVPNTMLNDIEITNNELYGETNCLLVENDDIIEKNIYETLFINYLNTIMVENRNTPTYIQNINGATRINNSINKDFDYSNMVITKYRINYQDETNMIGTTQCVITDNVGTFILSLYVGKLIKSIDLISEDENTIYQTIDGSSLQLNTYYTISQDIHIE